MNNIDRSLAELKEIVNILQIEAKKLNIAYDEFSQFQDKFYQKYGHILDDNGLNIKRCISQNNYNEAFLLYNRIVSPVYKKHQCDFDQFNKILNKNINKISK